MNGAIVRTDHLIENPSARLAPFLPEKDVARFLGMADSRQRRLDARKTVTDFAKGDDPIVELEPVRGGWRVYGPKKR